MTTCASTCMIRASIGNIDRHYITHLTVSHQTSRALLYAAFCNNYAKRFTRRTRASGSVEPSPRPRDQLVLPIQRA